MSVTEFITAVSAIVGLIGLLYLVQQVRYQRQSTELNSETLKELRRQGAETIERERGRLRFSVNKIAENGGHVAHFYTTLINPGRSSVVIEGIYMCIVTAPQTVAPVPTSHTRTRHHIVVTPGDVPTHSSDAVMYMPLEHPRLIDHMPPGLSTESEYYVLGAWEYVTLGKRYLYYTTFHKRPSWNSMQRLPSNQHTGEVELSMPSHMQPWT